MIIAEYNEKPVPLPISDEELIQLAQEEDSAFFFFTVHSELLYACLLYTSDAADDTPCGYQRVRPEKEASRIHDAAGNEPAGLSFRTV